MGRNNKYLYNYQDAVLHTEKSLKQDTRKIASAKRQLPRIIELITSSDKELQDLAMSLMLNNKFLNKFPEFIARVKQYRQFKINLDTETDPRVIYYETIICMNSIEIIKHLLFTEDYNASNLFRF